MIIPVVTRLEIYENGRKSYTEHGAGITGVPDKLGDLLTVIEGDNEVSQFYWNEQYSKLKAGEKQLIQVFYPGVDTRVTTKTKSPDKLIASIYSWCLGKENLRVTCPRCGGTGHYSYNQRDGTKCFKCWGKKFAIPKLSKKWIALVVEEWNSYKQSNAE